MKFAYEELSPGQFENLVVALCQFLLGAGAQGFTAGPDGGRDAKFVGTAEQYPSKSNPWIGTVIAQAKHTNGYNKSFSDAEFYGSDHNETVLGKELPRIKKLRENKALDHYMLFANRKLSGNGESKLRTIIAQECKLPETSICLCGVEQIEVWLKRFPHAANIANIDPIDSPLIVSPDDLAEVVEHLDAHLKNAVNQSVLPTDRTSYQRKNELNNMSLEYGKELRRRYLKDTQQIKTFLADPDNADVLERYESAVEEFQLQIVAKRKDYQLFDEVINYLVGLLVDRDPVLRANKRLTRTLIFYMYWNCDVGQNNDAASE